MTAGETEEGMKGGFAALGVEAALTERLGRRNIRAPTEIQRRVISRILDGQSVVFQAPTGTGKTFAYLLPLVQRFASASPPGPPRVLILSPTIELAAQIKHEIDFLLDDERKPLSARSVLISGGGGAARQAAALKAKPALVVGNVRRLLDLCRARKLDLRGLSALVLDEADRLVSDECIEETRALLGLIRSPHMTIALSATMPAWTQERLRPFLGEVFATEESASQEIIRNYITHWALWCEPRRTLSTLRAFLSAVKPRKALVFASRSEEVRRAVSELQFRHYPARDLWSGQDKRERKNALDAFRADKARILVTTDLAARGLDIPGLSHVIALGLTPDSETYIHRAGRTGRAGGLGVMVSIGDEEAMRALQRIEKKLGIVVYPKELYRGRLFSPEVPAPE